LAIATITTTAHTTAISNVWEAICTGTTHVATSKALNTAQMDALIIAVRTTIITTQIVHIMHIKIA
jgi:hypothetical protein